MDLGAAGSRAGAGGPPGVADTVFAVAVEVFQQRIELVAEEGPRTHVSGFFLHPEHIADAFVARQLGPEVGFGEGIKLLDASQRNLVLLLRLILKLFDKLSFSTYVDSASFGENIPLFKNFPKVVFVPLGLTVYRDLLWQM